MALITPDLINRTVIFSSKHPNDPVTWRGIIQGGPITHAVARREGDIPAYHAGVLRAHADLDPDYRAMSYFFIQLDTVPENGQPLQPFAEEWIQTGTFRILDEQSQVHLVVYDGPAADHSAIVEVLKEAGYTAKITKVV